MATDTLAVPVAEAKADHGIGALAKALAAAQRGIRSAQKDRTNPHYGQAYATLASVWDACRAQLSDNGLAVVQTTELTDKGTVILVTRLMHESGAEVSSRYPVIPVKTDPQGYGSALTYARRYSLASIVGVAPDDDDAESAQGRAPGAPRETRATPAPAPAAKTTPAPQAQPKAQVQPPPEEADVDVEPSDLPAWCRMPTTEDFTNKKLSDEVKRLCKGDTEAMVLLLGQIAKDDAGQPVRSFKALDTKPKVSDAWMGLMTHPHYGIPSLKKAREVANGQA